MRRELDAGISEMRPLPAPLVFVANLSGVAFKEVQRRSNRVWEASQSSRDELPGKCGRTQDVIVKAMSGFDS